MKKYSREMIFARFENIANTVYRGNQNSLCMLINDLEEFFEINNPQKSVDKMTTEEFDRYISKIRD